MPCDYISFKANKQHFAINFSLLPLIPLSINLSSRALRYTRGKCRSLAPQIEAAFFSMKANSRIAMASWLLSSGFQPKWKKCGKISCSQTYCQKNTFKGFWLNRNSNHIPESGPEPKLKRSAQISCFSFLSYRIFLRKLIFKSTSMHMCKSVSIHTPSMMLGYSQWALFLYLYLYKASQKYFSSAI